MATRDRRDRDTQSMSRRSPIGTSPTTRDPYGWSSSSWADPWSQFRRLSEQMDRWFDAFSTGRSHRAWDDSPSSARIWAPEIETFLRDDQFVIRMDLPGMSKDEVSVEVTDESVVIHGERQDLHEDKRGGYYRSERSYGSFYREVPLPEGAKSDSAKANYQDGVLEITVTAPPRQVTSARRVEIGTSSTTDRDERQRAAATPPSTSVSPASSMPIKDRTTQAERRSIAHDKGNE